MFADHAWDGVEVLGHSVCRWVVRVEAPSGERRSGRDEIPQICVFVSFRAGSPPLSVVAT